MNWNQQWRIWRNYWNVHTMKPRIFTIVFKPQITPIALFELIYHMVRIAINERSNGNKRVITFSAMLGDQIGHHIHGERWANQLYKVLDQHKLVDRPIHLVSANRHSF